MGSWNGEMEEAPMFVNEDLLASALYYTGFKLLLAFAAGDCFTRREFEWKRAWWGFATGSYLYYGVCSCVFC